MTKLDSPLEKETQREICDWLDKMGYFFWRQNNIPIFGTSNDGVRRFRAMPKYTPKGIPDILVLSEGKFYGLEVKRRGAMLRPDQAKFGAAMMKNGGFWYVVYDVQTVRELLGSRPPAL